MNDASSETFLIHPLLLAVSELVLSISEIVIHFVSPNDFQQMQQEDVNYHLREDNNAREGQIIRKFSLSNGITLWNLCLVCKKNNMCKNERHQKH